MSKHRKYNSTSKGRYREYRRRAKMKDLTFSLTVKQFDKLISSKCHYCLKTPDKYQGIDRKDNDKGYVKDNCTGCCSDCNYAKRTMSEKDFKIYLERITLSQIRKRPSLRKKVIELLKEFN